ncbi:MAG: glycosyltransferase [Acidobacteriota bacterium]
MSRTPSSTPPPAAAASASSDRAPAAVSGAPARVALVHDWLTGMRGGEKVLEALAALFPEAPIYTLFHFPGSVSEALESHPIHTSFLQRAPGLRRHYRRFLPLFPAAIEDLDLAPYDLVISSSHCVAKGIVPAPDALHLCYCHTPMRYAWDQEHAYFPRRRGLTARLRGLALTRLRTWDVASAPRVDAYFANSTFVARRIRRYYGREAEILHPPVDVDFYRLPPEAPGERPYALVVTALAPYKRVDLAITACQRLGLDLEIIGTGPELDRLRTLAGSNTRFLGRVPAETLRAKLQGARCLVQPGIEDFGIAPVEALACGTPVVALGRGGVLDIVENGVHGVLYEPPDDAEALAAAIDKSSRIRFNTLNLRARAEAFSTVVFVDRFASSCEALLSARWEKAP